MGKKIVLINFRVLIRYLHHVSSDERRQIGLEETIVKEIEQNQLTWYGHVQRMVEGRLPKITLKWMPKQKRARARPKKNWMEGIWKAMNERNLNEGQWEDRKQWSLGVGRRRKTFCNRYIYIGCPRRNVPDFGRVFLMLKYTDITQNTYIQSWTVTEIIARVVWNFDSCYTLVDYQIHIKTGRNMWFL